MLKPQEVNYVMYHNPCSDGLASALVVRMFMKEHKLEQPVTYRPSAYGSGIPEDIEGKNVLLCDFTMRKDHMDIVIKKAKNVLIIDHHKSAEKDLAHLPDHTKIFDMDKSGVGLTWTYFFPDKPLPLLFQYIQDRDLWKREMPLGDEFVAWFYSLPMEMDVYEEYLDDAKLRHMIDSKGVAFRELNQININSMIEYTGVKFVNIKNRFYLVGFLNGTNLRSDIGNAILHKFPLVDFSCVYSINDNTNSTSFSFRSLDDRVDVSQVAFTLGGGGHRNASGVKLNSVTNILGYDVGYSWSICELLPKIKQQHVEIEGKVYHVAMLMCPVKRRKLGQYLLQIKYGNVQTCAALLGVTDEFWIASVWSYDPQEDKTEHVISFHPDCSTNFRLQFCEKFGVEDGWIQSTGLHQILTPKN